MERSRLAFPLIEMRIEPKLKANRGKLLTLLENLARAEPGVFCKAGPGNENIVVGGMNEAQLDHIISTLKINGVDVRAGAPQIRYLETVMRTATADFTHKKFSSGQGEFARVILEVAPLERDAGFVFENKAAGGSVPAQFVAGVEKGVKTALASGPLFGMPIVDVKVALLDGAFHETDSSAVTFEIAARAAFRDATENAGPVLLESIVNVNVETPEESVGMIIEDLHSRRGKITDVSQKGATHAVIALVPLANMLGYINRLRHLTSGKGQFSFTYSHYAVVPRPHDGPGVFPPAVGMRA